MDDKPLHLPPRSTPVAEEAAELLGLLPDPDRSGHLRDRLRGRRHVLAVGDLDGCIADDLVTEPGSRAIQVSELLGGEQNAEARLATSGKQSNDVVGAECRELIDRDNRARGIIGANRPQPLADSEAR